MPLVTVQAIKQATPNVGTLSEDEAGRLIVAAEAAIDTYLCRQLATAAHEEWGDVCSIITLDHWPLTSLSSLTVDGQTCPQATASNPNGYRILRGSTQIALLGTWESAVPRPYIISYTAGYTADTVPADLSQAIIELVQLRLSDQLRVGKRSDGMQGQSTSYLVAELHPATKATLNRHRRVTL